MTTMLTPSRSREATSTPVATAPAPIAPATPGAPRPARRPVGPRRPAGPRRLPRQRAAGCVVADYPVRELVAAPGAAPRRAPARSVRLTRRGLVVVAAVTGVLAAALVWAAWLSAPNGEATAASGSAPATVTVQPGDTLWSIAGQVAPQRDPRAEVSTLQQLNHLTGVALTAGQVLRTR